MAEQILNLKVCDPAMGSGAFLVEACRQLAEELVAAWDREGRLQEIPSDEEPLLHARRLVAQRCLYGVDKNPFAVNLAKLSLWLVTLAKAHPFTFLDHTLKTGDSLVGVTRAEIGEFVQASNISNAPVFSLFKKQVNQAKIYRDEIGKLGDGDDNQKRDRFEKAEQELEEARLTGNVAIASFFAADKDKARKEKREEFSTKVNYWKLGIVNKSEIEGIAQSLHSLEKPVIPFSWEIEFPEVFERENRGFDVIVGNPPFAGSVALATSAGSHYTAYLREVYEGSGGKCDLVAFFFRRAFNLLRQQGCLGLIATNTIAQGDTRESSLSVILEQGNGEIYEARKRFFWPGIAAVIVTTIHLTKGKFLGAKLLDGKQVDRITAFLLSNGGNTTPAALSERMCQAFLGNKPGSRGYIFEPNPHPEANDIDLLPTYLKCENNKEVLRSYLGGSDLTTSPQQAPGRWIVDFGELSEEQVCKFSELYKLIKLKVKQNVQRSNWWQFSRSAKELRRALSEQRPSRVLVTGESTNSFVFAFQNPEIVFSNSIVVLLLESYAAFCLLQTRTHEVWTRTFSSTFKDDLRYVPGDCFETFPFPKRRN